MEIDKTKQTEEKLKDKRNEKEMKEGSGENINRSDNRDKRT